MRFYLSVFVFVTALLMATSSSIVYAKGKKITFYPPKKVKEYIEKSAGQKRLIYIYASWCPVCRKHLPDIIDLENIKKGSVIAVAVDEDQVAFTRFVKNLPPVSFKLIINDGAEEDLEAELASFGIESWPSYPSTVLMTADNKVFRQGYFKPDYIAKFLLSDEAEKEWAAFNKK